MPRPCPVSYTHLDVYKRQGNTRDLRPGDVVILNDGYLTYKGELHIVTKDMPNDGRKHVIGHLPEYEHVLLDYIEPWKVFAFRIV